MAVSKNFYLIEEELFSKNENMSQTFLLLLSSNKWPNKVLPSALFAYRTVNHNITTTLPIETDIKTIPFEEITIRNYKDILQKRLGTILDSLLKKKKTYKTLSLSVGDLVLEYHSDKDNVYGPFIVNKVLNNGFYILQDQSETIFNNHPENIIATILVPSITIRKTIKEILPIDKNLSYGRQLELYGYLGEIIEDIKLIKKTTSEIQVEILGIIQLDVPRVLTIARRAKTLIQRFGLLDTKLILPQVLYTLSTKDFNKLVSFELNKTLQLEYPINSLILPEFNLFGEDNVMIVIIDLINDLTIDLIIDLIIDLNNTNTNHPKVAESEIIEANYLGFTKFLFQQYSQQLRLNNNHFPAESVFNFYINNKITDCLGRTINIESTRENFYTELFQHTSLPRNYSFAPIIRKINQTIERYTQQFSITYTDKGKGKLQTPAVTPKQIQSLTWKKTRVESPTNPSYYYTLGSAINISSVDAKQKKAELLETYDFGNTSLWEIMESEKEEKEEAEDQKFTYQNPILENLEQTQNNPNPKTINQQNLPPVIIIDQSPIEPIIEPIQQQPLQPPQQPQQPF
ncbi:hypothetical protein G9A89_005581 [Geosiphon pyriformis]|nr:hypothetical protein G9A89_005581 [Geosiphon pyriformis]